jgi:hypothetical protein
VSPTFRASAGIDTRRGEVVAMEHDAVSGAAGRRLSSTRAPVWRPTPVVGSPVCQACAALSIGGSPANRRTLYRPYRSIRLLAQEGGMSEGSNDARSPPTRLAPAPHHRWLVELVVVDRLGDRHADVVVPVRSTTVS